MVFNFYVTKHCKLKRSLLDIFYYRPLNTKFYRNNFCGFKNKTSVGKVRHARYVDGEKLGLPKFDLPFRTLCV